MDATSQAIWYHVVTVVSLITFKLAVLVVGYLFAKLGHNLLIAGVRGEFKFQTGFKGFKADLVSVSPGVFFILMATVLIVVAILKDKPFDTTVTDRLIRSTAESAGTANTEAKPPLPENPPGE